MGEKEKISTGSDQGRIKLGNIRNIISKTHGYGIGEKV